MAFELASEGTRRLRLVLSFTAATTIFLGYVVLLVVYGAPYWTGWWLVMAVILALAFIAGWLFAVVFEWVIAGYRTENRRA